MASAMALSGCSLAPRNAEQSDIQSNMASAKTAIASEQSGPPVFDVNAETIGESPFWLYPVGRESKQKLPNKLIGNLHISEASLYDGLRLLLDQTGIALSFDGGQLQGASYQAVMINEMSGNLPDVVEKLSQAFGFFYRLEDGVLYIVQEDIFAMELPPILNDDSLANLTNALQYLGARDVYLDRANRTLTFKTSRSRLEYIKQYVNRIRETRSMIVYDLYIYQVDLTDANQTGIKWNKFNLNVPRGVTPLNLTGTGGEGLTGTDAASSFGVGLVYNSSRFSMDVLMQFLKTQGTVKAVSQPRIALMSGSRGKLRMGQSTRYVSKVGTNTSTALNQTTVETSDLQTGLDLSVYGDLHDGTIYTKLSLSLTNLIQFNKFTALGTDLTLPQTADREYRSTVRALPGDTILLGGLIEERDSLNISGLPLSERAVALGNRDHDKSKSELVLVLKSKVISFSKKHAAIAGTTAQPAGQAQ
jgi:type II secretory pathway component GspD/PulD (secretin)